MGDIFKLSASSAASEFCKWVQVGIDVYIPHHKYKLKPHSSPWFGQASNHCKRVLEAAKLTYATKRKDSGTSQKLGSWDFWQIADSVLNKGKSAIPPLCNNPDVLSSVSDKAKLFAKNSL